MGLKHNQNTSNIEGGAHWCTEMASRATVSKRKDNTKTGENFKVALRVRPLIAREILSNATQVNYFLSYKPDLRGTY